MLISDLTGSGQLPFAVGPRCIEAWLTEMLEIFALPEGYRRPSPQSSRRTRRCSSERDQRAPRTSR